ncbi:MAG: WD40 repeat domain-containing protein [Saprospiraceae bacterium]|nr:WD40 repeat domain-containing protein [Saprospiraceae bacterium]
MHENLRLTLQTKLTGHKGSIYGLDTSLQGDYLYSGAGDGWIVKWPTADHQDGKLLAEVGDQVFTIREISDTNCLMAGAFSGNLYFIDPTAQNKARNLIFHKGGIYDLLIHDGKLLTAGGDGRMGIWHLEDLEISESIRLSEAKLRDFALAPDNQILAVAASDNQIYILHLASGKVIDVIEDAHDNSVFAVVFSQCGQFLYSGGRDAHLKKWDLSGPISLVADINAHWYTINSLALHPSRPWLATASRDKTIRLWDANDLTLHQSMDAAKFDGHINSVNHLMWSPDGVRLYAASDDRSISVWETATKIE